MIRDKLLKSFDILLPERFNEIILGIVVNRIFDGDLDLFNNHLKLKLTDESVWTSQKNFICELDYLVHCCIPEFQYELFKQTVEDEELDDVVPGERMIDEDCECRSRQ